MVKNHKVKNDNGAVTIEMYCCHFSLQCYQTISDFSPLYVTPVLHWVAERRC